LFAEGTLINKLKPKGISLKDAELKGKCECEGRIVFAKDGEIVCQDLMQCMGMLMFQDAQAKIMFLVTIGG